MKLYYSPNTGRPMRVAWALEEIGASYELVRVDPADKDDAEHLDRQPLGRVPALEIDGTMLFDSTALLLHLADTYPDAGLIPPVGSPGRPEVYQWAMTTMTELEGPAVTVIVKQGSDPAQADAGRRRFAETASVYRDAIDGRGFIVGDRLTVADIVTGGVLSLADLTGMLEDQPELRSYLDGLRARPAYRTAADDTESLFQRG